MGHDGHGNECDKEPHDGKLMSAMVQSGYDRYYWSTCARHKMEEAIRSVYSALHPIIVLNRRNKCFNESVCISDLHCLDNKPAEPVWPVYTQPYGQSWTLNEQCRQEFGSGYTLCLAVCLPLTFTHNNFNHCYMRGGPFEIWGGGGGLRKIWK